MDARPPRFRSDEHATLLGQLRYQRASLLRNLDGLTDEQARWSPVGSGTCLLWLLRHAGSAESIWVLDRFARTGPEPDLLGNDVLPADTVESLTARYHRVWGLVDDVVDRNDLDAICTVGDDMTDPDLRWVLVHLCAEVARHAGHADILRELIDGTTGR